PAHDGGGVNPPAVAPVMVPQMGAQAGRAGLDLVQLPDYLLKTPLLLRALELAYPRMPLGRRPAEHHLEEVKPLLEREPFEGIDAAAVEEAAGYVQILLVRVGIPAECDAARARLDSVHPLVRGGDPGADDDVARSSLVLLRLIRLHHPIGGRRVVPSLSVDAGKRKRAVTDRNHQVLAPPDQSRVLVVEGEVRRRPRLAHDP